MVAGTPALAKRLLHAAIAAALVAALLAWPGIRELAASLHPDQIQTRLAAAGPWAPLLLMVMMAAAVVVSPIPSLPLDLAAGAYFGPLWGTAYAVLGALAGAMASFGLARLLGRGLVERVVGGHLNFCPRCSDKLLTRIVFFSRLVPLVSFDLVSYGAGLTKMSPLRFALATGIGMILPTLLYTGLGSSLRFDSRLTIPLGALLVLFFFLLPRWIEKHDLLSLRRHFDHPETGNRS